MEYLILKMSRHFEGYKVSDFGQHVIFSRIRPLTNKKLE